MLDADQEVDVTPTGQTQSPEEQRLARIEQARQSLAPKATDFEWEVFRGFCSNWRLNPFAKEVFYIDGVGIVVARDGYLRIAQRHPDYAGLQMGTVYQEIDTGRIVRFNNELGPEVSVDGKWTPATDINDASKLKPFYSWARVLGRNGNQGVVATARFQEYVKPVSTAWQKYPSAMLEKCAVSRACKHFAGISGSVGVEEVGQDE